MTAPDWDRRFLRRVDRSGECWEWLGTISTAGYGVFGMGSTSDGRRRQIKAHRFAYELWVAPIPDGLQIDHLCRTRSCVNPSHLEAVTGKVNTLRSEGVAAVNARKTHCPQGHPYDDANTYVAPNGQRGCRVCHRWHQSNYERKVRERGRR